jgi:hypothetical protein
MATNVHDCPVPTPQMLGNRGCAAGLLINTPLQRGAGCAREPRNRFNGFPHPGETVETVSDPLGPSITPLKRGVNERAADTDAAQ